VEISVNPISVEISVISMEIKKEMEFAEEPSSTAEEGLATSNKPNPSPHSLVVDSSFSPSAQEFSLFDLTQEERDDLLATIVYVEEPVTFECFSLPIPSRVFNYTKFYESLSEHVKSKVPDLSNLRTGDMLKMDDYRGCGSLYVMWLCPDLEADGDLYGGPYEYNFSEMQAALASLPDYHSVTAVMARSIQAKYELSSEEWELLSALLASDNWPEHPQFLRMQVQYPGLSGILRSNIGFQNRLRSIARARQNKRVPALVSRQSDGAHNDGLHHCYLFDHPDEYGYYSPTAVSCADDHYFDRDDSSAMLDPLLTHSQSLYGQLIRKCKEHPDRCNDPLFPLHYIGDCDRFYHTGRYDAGSIEWRTTKAKWTRDIFTRHFEVVLNNNYNSNYILK
jgi:hypothetical protein